MKDVYVEVVCWEKGKVLKVLANSKLTGDDWQYVKDQLFKVCGPSEITFARKVKP